MIVLNLNNNKHRSLKTLIFGVCKCKVDFKKIIGLYFIM